MTYSAGVPHGGGVVTPEAVRLDFDAASVGSRAVGYLIDAIAQAGLLFLLFLVIALAGGPGPGLPEWVAITLTLLLVFLVIWGYPIGFETLWRGRTPGKAAMGLRVVTVEGAPVGFRHAAIRAALGLVDFMLTFGFAAVVSALVSTRHQRLGDMVAGTLVLRERTGSRPPTAVRFDVPPGAESYAATLDVSGLGDRDYAAVRSFLLRAGELAPEVRARLAHRIAQPLAERLRHSPPQGVSPELFLACLAARYQQRAAGRTPSPAASPGPPAASVIPAPPRQPDSDTPRESGAPETGGDDRGGFQPPA